MQEAADYADDPAIEDDAALWRRVPPQWVVLDENTGEFRPSSAAFRDSNSGSPMSILIEEIVRATNRVAADVLIAYASHSLCTFSAGTARSLNQGIATRPEVLGEPAHGFVVGRKTGSVRTKFSKASRWVILVTLPPA